MSQRYTIGRNSAGKAEILLPGSTISARHAELVVDDHGKLLLRDIGSSNGTKVIRSGKEIVVSSTPVSLLSSDVVGFGKERFAVDALLAKMPARQTAAAPSAGIADAGPERKMRRCPACGCVTPLGGACIECGYTG